MLTGITLIKAETATCSNLIVGGDFQYEYHDGSTSTKSVDCTGYAIGSRNLTEQEWDAAVKLVNGLNAK